jgi:hypothetical protein
MYCPPRLARVKLMIELVLHQCIRPLASALIFQPGRKEGIDAFEAFNEDTRLWCSTTLGGAPVRSACSCRMRRS